MTWSRRQESIPCLLSGRQAASGDPERSFREIRTAGRLDFADGASYFIGERTVLAGLFDRDDPSADELSGPGIDLQVDDRSETALAAEVGAGTGAEIPEAAGDQAVVVSFDCSGDVGSVTEDDFSTGIDAGAGEKVEVAAVFPEEHFGLLRHPAISLRPRDGRT